MVGIDRKVESHTASMVPSKGNGAHAIKTVACEMELAGYSKMDIKSDQESFIFRGHQGSQEGTA